jgi:hypothetical protein
MLNKHLKYAGIQEIPKILLKRSLSNSFSRHMAAGDSFAAFTPGKAGN